MNYIKIKKISDLQTVIDAPIHITGNEMLQQEEVLANTWGISFAPSMAQKITMHDLISLYDVLIRTRRDQIAQIKIPATVYMWFDAQADQLRFNTISGCSVALPFGCKLEIVNSPEIIFHEYLAAQHHGILPLNEVEFLDDCSDDDEEDDTHYVLKLFFICIDPTH